MKRPKTDPKLPRADADRVEELDRSDNPFAVLVKAHLVAQGTRSDASRRLVGKLEIVKALYRKRCERQEVLDLLWLIDWLMALPPEMETTFHEEIERFEEEEKVAYIPSWAREAHQEGIQARLDDLLKVAAERFGSVPDGVADVIRSTDDPDRLSDLLLQSVRSASIEEFQGSLRPPRS